MRLGGKFLLLLLLPAVSACGDGGGGGGDDASSAGAAVSGTASKGPLRNADIKRFQLTAGGFAGTPVLPAETTTPDGNFSTTPSAVALLLETSDGDFLDESDPAINKRRIDFGPDEGLLGIQPGDNSTSNVAITPITTALVLKSRREAGGSGFLVVFENNRAIAQQVFSFDVVTTLPTDPTSPTGTTAQKQYAMVLGGVAQAINSAAVRLGMPAPDFDLIWAVMEDLSDGRLDGEVDGSPVVVGSGPAVLPDDIKLNAEINRFRNNNAAHYQNVPLVVVNENTWSQSGGEPGGPAPVNDNFADAVTAPIPVPFTINVDTTGANTESSEPQPCGSIGATVWYNWTPNFTGTAIINTLGSSHHDPVLAAYTGGTLANLVAQACDDDRLFFVQALQSQITFDVSAGTTYRIQAGGFSAEVGNLTINFDRDSDDDDLGDAREAGLGTNPNNFDTDGDGLSDGNEVNDYGTNPLAPDSDGDGLTDRYEVDHGLDPLVADSCLPPPHGMVTWYPGDNHADDIKGTHHGGFMDGASPVAGTYAPGQVAEAFSFDGANDGVATNLDVQPSAMSSVTWDAWVYPTRVNHPAAQAILSADDGGFDRQVGIRENTGNFYVHTGDTGGGTWEPTSVDVNQWQHVAVVYTPTDIKFYKNGQEFSFGMPATGQASNNRLHIGKNPFSGSGGQYFQGLVDEVEVFDRALSQPEIEAIYGIGDGGKCKPSCVGSGSDLWQHTNFAGFASTGLISGSNESDMFGATTSSIEPGVALFKNNQPAGFAHSIRWELASPVTISRFTLLATHDANPSNPERAMNRFRLYSCSTLACSSPQVVYDSPVVVPYGTNSQLAKCLNVLPITSKFFKAEFMQALPGHPSNGGPRIVELDGFGP